LHCCCCPRKSISILSIFMIFVILIMELWLNKKDAGWIYKNNARLNPILQITNYNSVSDFYSLKLTNFGIKSTSVNSDFIILVKLETQVLSIQVGIREVELRVEWRKGKQWECWMRMTEWQWQLTRAPPFPNLFKISTRIYPFSLKCWKWEVNPGEVRPRRWDGEMRRYVHCKIEIRMSGDEDHSILVELD